MICRQGLLEKKGKKLSCFAKISIDGKNEDFSHRESA